VRLDVAATPNAVAPAVLPGTTVLVVDVLRASTTIIAALGNGSAAVVPVGDAAEARARARAEPEGTALIAGERRGEPLAGFDLGNSPLEFTRERVGGRLVFLTTSNGTRALLAARRAPAVGVAALVNATAAAAWAAAEGRDLLVLCAGARGRRALEDEVCAGALAASVLARDGRFVPTAGAQAARRAAARYGKEVGRLRDDAPWARHLVGAGRSLDVDACLALDTTTLVPRYLPGVDKIILGRG
jgi:2-phosphosulfolactate phosphatase